MGIVRCQESDDVGDVVRLRETLESLHAERSGATLVGLERVFALLCNEAWCNAVYTNPARTQRECEMLHESIESTFGGGVRGNRAEGSMSGKVMRSGQCCCPHP